MSPYRRGAGKRFRRSPDRYAAARPSASTSCASSITGTILSSMRSLHIRAKWVSALASSASSSAKPPEKSAAVQRSMSLTPAGGCPPVFLKRAIASSRVLVWGLMANGVMNFINVAPDPAAAGHRPTRLLIRSRPRLVSAAGGSGIVWRSGVSVRTRERRVARRRLRRSAVIGRRREPVVAAVGRAIIGPLCRILLILLLILRLILLLILRLVLRLILRRVRHLI